MSHASSYSFGGRMFGAILLGLLAGFGWACWETGRSPLDLVKIFSGKEEKKGPVQPPSPAPVARKESPRTEPVAVKKEPSKTEPAPVAPAPATPVKRTYSPGEMTGLFASLDDLVRRGRFHEAAEKLNTADQQMIPADGTARFADSKARIETYNALMHETTRGHMIDMPKMHELFLKGRDRGMIVKVQYEDTRSVSYETITGIRSSLDRSRIDKMTPLEPLYAEVSLKMEHKEQCRARGLEVTDEGGLKPLVYKETGAKLTGQQFFDLADFCARNGANRFLAALFDEALKRDRDLLTTVHETKADRMVKVFLYFLSINSAADAGNALDLLQKKYGDTRAFREEVATDTDVQQAIGMILRRPPATAVAVGTPAPGPAVTPTPVPVSPAPGPAPDPFAPLAQGPKPATPKTQGVDLEGRPPAPANPTSATLEGAPPRVAELVSKGDKFFDEAMQHLRASDPEKNPGGWADENKKALECFQKAFRECYEPAQEQYGKGAVPQPLLDRARETLMRQSLCRKRSVSTRTK